MHSLMVSCLRPADMYTLSRGAEQLIKILLILQYGEHFFFDKGKRYAVISEELWCYRAT